MIMALDLVTGYKGAAHITAEDVGAFNAGVFGSGEYVLNTGNKFSASLTSNNTVKILDGDLMMQGRHITLRKDTFEEVTIENGTSGQNRNDLIVARYTKDSDTGVENVAFAVIKGAETTGTATDPEYTTGDILSGNCTLSEMPLYRIPLSGLTVGTPEAMYEQSEQSLCDMTGLLYRGELKHEFYYANESNPKHWRNVGSGIFKTPAEGTPGYYIGGSFYGSNNKGTLVNIVSELSVTQLFCTGSAVFMRTSKETSDEWSSDWRLINSGTKSFSGQYSGTGLAGSNNKNSLTLSMHQKPKVVIIRHTYNTLVITDKMDWAGWFDHDGNSYSVSTSITQVSEGKYAVLWWSSNGSPLEQMNQDDIYYYVAFA